MGEDESLYRNQDDFRSKYRAVIDYFDAVKIALTATPALHTTQIFGEPVFTYSYREAVIDGWLVDHDPPYIINTDFIQNKAKFEKGETLAKVMKTLVMYGEAFGAEKMVPITSKYNHLVTSFGLKVMAPVYDLMQQLLDAGVVSDQKFSVDPRPLDKNVPANFLQNLVFNKLMYTKQNFYEEQLSK